MKSEPTREAVAAKVWVRLAKEQTLALEGPNGLLGQFTKTFLEAALHEEITEHLGHEKNRARTSVTIRTCGMGLGPKR